MILVSIQNGHSKKALRTILSTLTVAACAWLLSSGCARESASIATSEKTSAIPDSNSSEQVAPRNTPGHNSSTQRFKLYEVQSGTIEYRYTSAEGFHKSKGVMYFDDYGWRQAWHETLTVGDGKNTYKIIAIMRGTELILNYDNMMKNIALRFSLSGLNERLKSLDTARSKTLIGDMIRELEAESKIKPIRKAKYGGQECDLYRHSFNNSMDICFAHMLTLYSYEDGMSDSIFEAINVNFGPVEQGLFEVPKGLDEVDGLEAYMQEVPPGISEKDIASLRESILRDAERSIRNLVPFYGQVVNLY